VNVIASHNFPAPFCAVMGMRSAAARVGGFLWIILHGKKHMSITYSESYNFHCMLWTSLSLCFMV